MTVTSEPGREARLPGFYLVLALAMCVTAFWGFFYTYFSPILAGRYLDVSWAVHLHGWSFYFWFLLLPLQAFLIASGRDHMHMALGKVSLLLVAVMLLTGLMVVSVRVDGALKGAQDGFSLTLLTSGPLIFVSLFLFAGYYGAAVIAAIRGHFETHKRLIVLASAYALPAAVFRIVGNVIGFSPWTVVHSMYLVNGFVIAAIIYDALVKKRIFPVYIIGLVIGVGAELTVTPFAGNPMVPAVNAFVASMACWFEGVY